MPFANKCRLSYRLMSKLNHLQKTILYIVILKQEDVVARIISICLLSFVTITAEAQKTNVWNNKKCAVVLTYDDALDVDLDHAMPALDSIGLKATFFLSGYFPGCRERLPEWRKVAANGHELGNHTLFHPCLGTGRSWVKPDYDLTTYSLTRLIDEIRMNNTLLESLDGKTIRTFAYPCGDTRVGDTTYVEAIKDYFVSARGVNGTMYKINELTDLYNIGSYAISGQSADDLITLVKTAMEKNSLLVFLFHGVGGGHDLNVGLKEHSQLLHFLKQNEKDIWVAPFADVTEFVKGYNGRPKK